MDEKRDQLVEKGMLIEKEGHLVFTKDMEFGSPGTAGGIVRGGASNGLINWKNSDGFQLKEIETKQ
jgi:hypothetical protein